MEQRMLRFRQTGIVPVAVIDDVKRARRLGEAVIKGGLDCVEVSFLTEAAEMSIRTLVREFPDLFVGAGNVLTTEQVDAAVKAGAKFIAASGLSPEVVGHCRKKGIIMIPGVQTPSEIEQAIALGVSVVRFFPSEASGGIKMLRALSVSYPQITFMPNGGISPGNLRNYLKQEMVLACSGSWMVRKELIAAEKFLEIERMVREAAKIVKDLRGDEEEDVEDEKETDEGEYFDQPW